ncbi:Gfo/Idh/MocA family oxidoreductase [Halosimplex litoreum]|uniref:Gfo/Idh/MocA family oxidoreductase n=1 Tax=Halosimplex litoreum TaxID=1198301 RepID=A0A7T3KV59_9EURY|nr:Gfo/Idh/MocA family oxidoreductase [Halosimplex litoreum]QPV62952.1 Gfo/Idh/MocA family oxidoreductase [Halosimplex litoreum]
MVDISSVRLGIVGLGNIGHHHAERFVDQGANLVGGVDIAEGARASFGDEFGVPTYQDHHELYDEVDAVAVTTPNKFHEQYVVDALEQGLDVLVEKPLANTLEAAERIADAARAAEGFCMVGFHTRFESPVEVINGYRQEGRFGELSHVEANYIRRRGVPGRGSWFTSKEVAGGGALIDIGVHAVDLSLYLLGYPDVEEVSGVTRSQFGGRDDYTYIQMWGDDQGPEGFNVDDSATALIRCAEDRTISLEVAWAVNRPKKQEYVLRGTEAGATFRPGEGVTFHESGTQGAGHMVESEVETRGNDAHAAEQTYFLEHCAAGETPERNTVDQGLTVQRVLDGIYRSSETGEAVPVED